MQTLHPKKSTLMVRHFFKGIGFIVNRQSIQQRCTRFIQTNQIDQSIFADILLLCVCNLQHRSAAYELRGIQSQKTRVRKRIASL